MYQLSFYKSIELSDQKSVNYFVLSKNLLKCVDICDNILTKLSHKLGMIFLKHIVIIVNFINYRYLSLWLHIFYFRGYYIFLNHLVFDDINNIWYIGNLVSFFWKLPGPVSGIQQKWKIPKSWRKSWLFKGHIWEIMDPPRECSDQNRDNFFYLLSSEIVTEIRSKLR